MYGNPGDFAGTKTAGLTSKSHLQRHNRRQHEEDEDEEEAEAGKDNKNIIRNCTHCKQNFPFRCSNSSFQAHTHTRTQDALGIANELFVHPSRCRLHTAVSLPLHSLLLLSLSVPLA